MFFDDVFVSGTLQKVICDPGSGKKRVIRGTEINSTKPFIICEFNIATGEHVELCKSGEKYRVSEVEKSACGFFTAFLEREHGNRSDYLSKEEDL